MNLDAAPTKADEVRGPKSAARLYADIEYELSEGGADSEEQQLRGEAALRTLEERFPGIKQAADEVVANGHIPAMSRRAKRRMDAPRPALHARTRGEHQAERRRPNRTPRERVASATAIHARAPRGSRAARVARMRWQQTGVPGAAESATQLVMSTIGVIVGLSFLYVVVGPNGSRAVSLTSSGIGHVINGLASPTTDPLRPRATAPTRRAAAVLPSGPNPAGTVTTAGVNHSVLGHAN